MKRKEYINAINEIEVDEKMKQNVLKNVKNKNSYKRKYSILATSIVAVVIGISIVIPLTINKNKVTQIEIAEENNGLPKLENFETLYDILKKNSKSDYSTKNSILGITANADIAAGETTTANSATKSTDMKVDKQENSDYSKTNTQVEGVDEADIVKTDGEYIYYVIDNNILIINAEDSKNLNEVSKIDFEKDKYDPTEIYINNDKLIVIGEESNKYYTGLKPVYSYTSHTYKTYTTAKVYNIEDRTNPKLDREVKIKGDYLSSRMIGDNIFFITNDSIYTNRLFNVDYDEINKDDFKPAYIDTYVSSEESKIEFDDIYYFPDSEDTSYLSIAGFNINNNEKANIETYLGAGTEIYSSENNLYITRTEYEYKNSRLFGYYDRYDVNTYIYKFKLENSKATYINAGSVPGELLNQFSMDECDGYFRIATTDSDSWNSETDTNNLYVLDENLQIVGKVENLAKGEKIYSVRFMQNRAYMVTFVETDPLFVIDLSNPKEPTVLGELKIPGYSKYLHPYDETHLIGFGERTRTNEFGGVVTDGMKMALFDVSDAVNPKELYSIDIGDKGTYSEILDNHKALLFSKEKNILAFPISIKEEYDEGFSTTKLKFQGAIVYGVDLENGFKLKGTIAHMKNELDGYKDLEYGKEVERIIYINDSLYTLSQELIKSTNINTMEEEGSLEIK